MHANSADSSIVSAWICNGSSNLIISITFLNMFEKERPLILSEYILFLPCSQEMNFFEQSIWSRIQILLVSIFLSAVHKGRPCSSPSASLLLSVKGVRFLHFSKLIPIVLGLIFTGSSQDFQFRLQSLQFYGLEFTLFSKLMPITLRLIFIRLGV